MAVPTAVAGFARSSNNAAVYLAFLRNTSGPAVTGYRLYHSTDNVTFSALTTTFDDIGSGFNEYRHLSLTNGTTHYYYVVAYNGDGESTHSATLTGSPLNTTDLSTFIWSQFHLGTLPALTMVAGLTYDVDMAFRNDGTATWTRDNYYRNIIKPTTDTDWTATRLLLPSDASITNGQTGVFSATVTAPSTPGSYGMQWRTQQEFNAEFGDSSPLYTIAVILLPPDAPTNLAADAGDDQVYLSWTAPITSATRPAVTSYSVKRSTGRIDPSTTYVPVSGLTLPPGPGTLDETTIATGITALYYNDTTALNGVDYTYRVVALNDWGTSDPSNEASAVPYCCSGQGAADAMPASTLVTEAMPVSTLVTEGC